jgi:hypothetical protein
LTVGKCRVGSYASVRSLVGEVKEVERINISGSELSSLNGQVTEEPASLVQGSDECTTNVGKPVAGLITGVFPAVNLDHCHDILNTHAFLSSYHCDFLDVFAFNTKTLVEGLSEDVVGCCWMDFLENRENNWDGLGRKKWRPVVGGAVNPSKHEIVVTVWETFSLEEKINGGLFVEILAYVSPQRKPSNMKVNFLSSLDPISPESALKTADRPKPGFLRLNYVEFPVKAKSHSAVADVRASTVHDN